MPFPFAAVGAGASLLGSLFGAGDAKKQNRLTKEQLEIQKRLADDQIEQSRFLREIANGVLALQGGFTGADGSRISFDNKTGQTSVSLGNARRNLQNLSDEEETKRLSLDQALRRRGLEDSEKIRRDQLLEAVSGRKELDNFDRGIGQVDPNSIGAQLRLDRERSVNAGYDEAAELASVLARRTSNTTLTDSLQELARSRARDRLNVGSPEVEGIEFANNINLQRRNQLAQILGQNQAGARSFYDTGYQPTPYSDIANQGILDQQRLDLARREVAAGGTASAAAGIGSAAAGLRSAYNDYQKNRIANPNGQLFSSLGSAIGNFGG